MKYSLYKLYENAYYISYINKGEFYYLHRNGLCYRYTCNVKLYRSGCRSAIYRFGMANYNCKDYPAFFRSASMAKQWFKKLRPGCRLYLECKT